MDRLAIIELQRWGFPGVTKYVVTVLSQRPGQNPEVDYENVTQCLSKQQKMLRP